MKKFHQTSKPILNVPLKKNYGTTKGIGDYLKVFIQSWTPYLDKDTQLHWCIHQTKTDSMIAVVFSIYPKTDIEAVKDELWDSVGMDSSMTVTDDHIIIIKCNQMRLWTKSMAREDAEATLVQAMNRK